MIGRHFLHHLGCRLTLGCGAARRTRGACSANAPIPPTIAFLSVEALRVHLERSRLSRGGTFDEDAELRSSSDPNVYGVQKAESELALFARAETDGLPIIVPEGGEQTMQWVHADDVADASLRAASRETDGAEAFNLPGPPVTQNEFIRTLGHVVGVEPELVHVPHERIEAARWRPPAVAWKPRCRSRLRAFLGRRSNGIRVEPVRPRHTPYGRRTVTWYTVCWRS